jgi:uncharacterized protein (TIGR01777 family)
MPSIAFTSPLPVSAARAFAWHEANGAFERLNPPWAPATVLSSDGSINNGARVSLKVPLLGPISATMRVVHEDYQLNKQFCDRQEFGPFRAWKHTHQFESTGPNSCDLIDTIEYELPWNGTRVGLLARHAERQLNSVFTYRHSVTASDLSRFVSPLENRIAVTGSSGLVGSSLVPFLTAGGATVNRLVRTRTAASSSHILWNPERGYVDTDRLAGIDTIVHLAGAGIADRPWTQHRKTTLRSSRVEGTSTIVQGLRSLNSPPKTLICASAVGFYGPRADEMLYETSPKGVGFLADLCEAWEHQALEAERLGIRVVILRFGVILSPLGGALRKLLPVFKAGLGGPIGTGLAYFPWTSIEDVLGVIHRAIIDSSIKGIYNLTSPSPITNREFAKTLGTVLHRPTIIPVPEMVLRAMLGEMAEQTLIASQRVVPRRLMEADYPLEGDISHYLQKQLGAARKFNPRKSV